MKDLKGKVAVITGAGSGIGEGIAHAAAEAGMKVVVSDINLASAEKVANDLRESGSEAIAVQADVSDYKAVEAMRELAIKTFGSVYLLVNNAGVWSGKKLTAATLKDWDFIIKINLQGVINGIKAFGELLEQQGEGHIVNNASMGGIISGVGMLEAIKSGKINPESLQKSGEDEVDQGLYMTTKFAVVGLSEALATEVAAKGVGVSLLCPGLVKTNLIDKSASLETGADKADPNKPAPDVDSGISARSVGDMVIDAVRENHFYIITHDDYLEILELRHRSIEEAVVSHAERYGSTRSRNS